jgi:hypothetical protein
VKSRKQAIAVGLFTVNPAGSLGFTRNTGAGRTIPVRRALCPWLTYVNDGIGSNTTLKGSNRRIAVKIVTRRSLFAIAAALALVLGVGTVAWAMFLRPIRVEIASIERDVPVQVFGLGTVEARVTSKVGFKVAGVLVDLWADVGDRVAKGAVLARLDDREQSARVRRSQATIEQAEACGLGEIGRLAYRRSRRTRNGLLAFG